MWKLGKKTLLQKMLSNICPLTNNKSCKSKIWTSILLVAGSWVHKRCMQSSVLCLTGDMVLGLFEVAMVIHSHQGWI